VRLGAKHQRDHRARLEQGVRREIVDAKMKDAKMKDEMKMGAKKDDHWLVVLVDRRLRDRYFLDALPFQLLLNL